MKRTGFSQKTRLQAVRAFLALRSTFKTGKPPAYKLGRKRGGILRAGKKVKEWDRVRAKLKKQFQAQGITTCELGYDGCKRDDYLSFAHGRKRRKLEDNELETLTILACQPCHDRIERMAHEGMLAIVQSVISERGL